MSGTPPSRRVANSPLYNFIRASSLLEPLAEASRQDSGFSSCPGISDRNTPQLSNDAFISPQSSQAQQPKPTVPLSMTAGGLRLNRMPGSESLDVDLADTMLVSQLSELDTRSSSHTPGSGCCYTGRRFRPLEPAGTTSPLDVLDGLGDDENQSIARSPLVRFDDNNGDDGSAVQFRFFDSEFIPSSPSSTSAFLNGRNNPMSSTRLVASSPLFCRFSSTPTGYRGLGRQVYAFRPCSAPLNDSSPLEEVEEDTDEDELNASAAIMCGQSSGGPICSCSGTSQTPLLSGPPSNEDAAGCAFVASSLQPTLADPRRLHRSIATQTSEEHQCYPASSAILRRPFAMARSRRPLRTFARPQSAPLNDDQPGQEEDVEAEESQERGGLRAVTLGESRFYALRHREAEDTFCTFRGSRSRLAGDQVGADSTAVAVHPSTTTLPSVSVYITEDVFAPEDPVPTLTPGSPGVGQCMPDVVPTSRHDVPDESPGLRGPRVGGPRPASTPLSELALLRASETEGRAHFRRLAARRRHSFNQENLSIFAQRMADIADALERDHSQYRRRRSWSIQFTGADAQSNDSFPFGRLTRTASSSLAWLSSSMAELVSHPINYLYRWFSPASREQNPRLRTSSVIINRPSRGSWVERSRTFSMEVRGPRPPFLSSFDMVDVLPHSGGRPGRSPQLPYEHPVFTLSPDALSGRSDVDRRTPIQDDESEGIR